MTDYCVAPSVSSASVRTFYQVQTDIAQWNQNIIDENANLNTMAQCVSREEGTLSSDLSSAGQTYVPGTYANYVRTSAQLQLLTDAAQLKIDADALEAEIVTHRSNVATWSGTATGELIDLKNQWNLETQKDAQGVLYVSRLSSYTAAGSPPTIDWTSLKTDFDNDWTTADNLTSSLNSAQLTSYGTWDGNFTQLPGLLSTVNTAKNDYFNAATPTQALRDAYDNAVSAYNSQVIQTDSLRTTYDADYDAWQANLNLKTAINDVRTTVHTDQQSWQSAYDAYPGQVQADTADSFYVQSNSNFAEKEVTLKTTIKNWLQDQVAYESYVTGLAGSAEDPNNSAVINKNNEVLNIQALLYTDRDKIAWTIDYLTNVANNAASNKITYASPGSDPLLGPNWFQNLMLNEANDFEDFTAARRATLIGIFDGMITSSRNTTDNNWSLAQANAGTNFDVAQKSREDAVKTDDPTRLNLYDNWQAAITDTIKRKIAWEDAILQNIEIADPQEFRARQAAIVAAKVLAISSTSDANALTELKTERDAAADLVRNLSIPSWVSGQVSNYATNVSDKKQEYENAIAFEQQELLQYNLGRLDAVRFTDSAAFSTLKSNLVASYNTPISNANATCIAKTTIYDDITNLITPINNAAINQTSLRGPSDTSKSNLSSQSCTVTSFYTEALNKATTIYNDYTNKINAINVPLNDYPSDIGFIDVGLTARQGTALTEKNKACAYSTSLIADQTSINNVVLGSTRAQDIAAVTKVYTDWGNINNSWANFYPSQYTNPYPVVPCTVDTYNQYKALRQILWDDVYNNQKRVDWETCTGITVRQQAFGPDVTTFLNGLTVSSKKLAYDTKLSDINLEKSNITTKTTTEENKRQLRVNNLASYNSQVQNYNLQAEVVVNCNLNKPVAQSAIIGNTTAIANDRVKLADRWNDYWTTEQPILAGYISPNSTNLGNNKDALGYAGVAYDSTYFIVGTSGTVTSVNAPAGGGGSAGGGSTSAGTASGTDETIDDFQVLPKLSVGDRPTQMTICRDSSPTDGQIVGLLVYYGNSAAASSTWTAGGLHGRLEDNASVTCTTAALTGDVSAIDFYTYPMSTSPTFMAVNVAYGTGSNLLVGTIPTDDYNLTPYTFDQTGVTEFFGFKSDHDSGNGEFLTATTLPDVLVYQASQMDTFIQGVTDDTAKLDYATRENQAALDSQREWQEIAIYNKVIAVDLWTSIPAAVPINTYVIRQEEVTREENKLDAKSVVVNSEIAWGQKEDQRATELTQYNADVLSSTVRDSFVAGQTAIDGTWVGWTSATAIEQSNELITLETALSTQFNAEEAAQTAEHEAEIALMEAELLETIKFYRTEMSEILGVPYSKNCDDECLEQVWIKAIQMENVIHDEEEDQADGGVIVALVVGCVLIVVLFAFFMFSCKEMRMGEMRSAQGGRQLIVSNDSQRSFALNNGTPNV